MSPIVFYDYSVKSTWDEILQQEFSAPYFLSMSELLHDERKKFHVFPPEEKIFAALDASPFDHTKVVILGQDPYHGAGQAHGLSFSVQHGTRIPPSLRNIYTELHTDLDIPIPTHGNLEAWAKHGVLLLNTSLTVREGEAGSHAGRGWETFTDAIISYLGSQEQHTVFVLWGAHAGKKASLIHQHHTVITSVHPSPLSAHRGFFGSRPFSQVNRALLDHNQSEINWRLESE